MSSSISSIDSTSAVRQLSQVESYISTCHPLFQSLLTELALKQPNDPIAFLSQQIQNFPESQRQQLATQIQKHYPHHTLADSSSSSDSSSPTSTAVSSGGEDRSKSVVTVLLTLRCESVSGVRSRVVEGLRDLQRFSLSLSGCLRYEIFEPSPNPNPLIPTDRLAGEEIVVIQSWATQGALNEYYASKQFRDAAPRFKGLLIAPPEERVLTSV